MDNDDKASDPTAHVHSLIAKGAEQHDSADAMRYTQAALNAANAIRTLEPLHPKPQS